MTGADIPLSVRNEHREFHAALVRAIGAGGRTGEAAEEVERILDPHFEKEEVFALPPLGLLAPLSKGEAVEEREEVLGMTSRLATELPSMLEDHRRLVSALDLLRVAAVEEGLPGTVRFAGNIILHAQMEEEVLYPAALLVGRYLGMQG